MSFFSRSLSKKHSKNTSTLDSVPVSGLPSSQSQPVHPWSAHTPPIGKSRSPFPREGLTLSMSASAGEMFLFGGCIQDIRRQNSGLPTNDLFLISTRDFSTTRLKTSGVVPSPRFGHRAVFISTDVLLIWGGTKEYRDQTPDNPLYLFNIVSLEWTCIVVNGPGPAGRYYHSMTLVGSKLFVFGGSSFNRNFDDIWALDLGCLYSKPFWESYDPVPRNEKKPLPRAGHVSVATGDHIIIFGGYGSPHTYNDAWSFNTLTRKWAKLQCTGPIPSPRSGHTAIVIGDFMYVYGGAIPGGLYKGDLTALNLSTKRWVVFQDIGPNPKGRTRHAMACDGERVFMLGGALPSGAQADESKLIHILDTKHLDYLEPGSNAVSSYESSASSSPPTRKQSHQPSLSDANGSSPAIPKKLDDPISQQITRKQNPRLNDPPSRPPKRLTGASGTPRPVPEDSESSTEHHPNPVASNAPGKGIARLEDGRLIELERQLSEMVVAKTERDRYIAQLTDELTRAAEEKRSAGLELRKLQMKLEQAEANAMEARERAGLEQRELQMKVGELIMSRDKHLRMLEQAQSALQKATSRTADEPSQLVCEHETELAELHAKLEGKESELAAVRLRLTAVEDGWVKSMAEVNKLTTVTAANMIDSNEDQTLCDLKDDFQVMVAKLMSPKLSSKSAEDIKCGNEG